MKKTYRQRRRLGLIVIVAAFFLSGCVGSLGGGKKIPPVAGLFQSRQNQAQPQQLKGDVWEGRQRLLVAGGFGSLANLSLLELYPDPKDFRTFYLSSPGVGLLYTYDAAQTWQQAREITSGTVNDVAIDPRSTCTVYVAIGNQILKTIDCNRNYREIYLDSRPNAVMTVTVDATNSAIVYLGTSAGELFRSVNSGESWSRAYQFDSSLRWLAFDPNNARRAYALTTKNGLWRSTDGAQTWQSLANGLQPYSQGQEINVVQFVNDQPNTMYLLNRYGLLKSGDAGDTWQALSLITLPLSTKILAFAVNPNNSKELFYATASTFYRSTNGGSSWDTRRLPGRGAAPQFLTMHPRDASTLYLGLSIVTSKK
ncbi:MAG: YCF48-related protein [Patescibacteria group bacterium]|nr:YCF48-related protein [Patescibacteria group bacterium]